MQIIAFSELQQKQRKGEKGRNIVYRSLSMADYLLPEANLTVEEKKKIFSIRLEMNENSCNFGVKILCEMGCSEIQENSHILVCPKLNESEQELNIEDILNGSLPMKVKVLKRFEENLKKKKICVPCHPWNPLLTALVKKYYIR